MKLLLDVGNSRIKWALLRQGALESSRAMYYEKSALLDSLQPGLSKVNVPEQVVISNVGGEKIAAELSAYFTERWGLKPDYLQVSDKFAGFTNAYDDVGKLGVDRWLAMIAAWNRYKQAVCVVDCGTAVTVDIVSASGYHQGGYIVPGLTLMSEALNVNTAQINTSTLDRASLQFGLNTGDCVANGALAAISGLIQSACDQLVQAHGTDWSCIITGGNAEKIQATLKIEVAYDPDLVLNGMVSVIGYSK